MSSVYGECYLPACVCVLGGLTCVCSPDNTNCGKSGTCEVGVGGVCYAQFYSDIFDAHWTVQKGCLTDRSAPVCEHNLSDSHQGGCCSEDMCNAHFELGELERAYIPICLWQLCTIVCSVLMTVCVSVCYVMLFILVYTCVMINILV